MKFCLSFLMLFASSLAFAQVDLMQSPPSIKWKSIENNSVKVIYPDYLGVEPVYIANLVEHYSKVVGQTYNIEKPKQFNLIVRTEIALPNGYVTLAPRRSEWFTNSTFFPYVGATEWLQTLSIHEYRHVNQFDNFMYGSGTKVFQVLMGDMGVQLAAAMTMPSWYMEGDAVWTETKYTDAGRGRSPRFLERIKAIVLSGDIPSYDEFLSGSYKTNLPNQYVYGYALISYGTIKYGDQLWQKVADDAAKFPNPFRFYTSFERVTGQKFEDFYAETMNDLKTKWSADAPTAEEKVDYRESYSPGKNQNGLYYVHQTMNTVPTIYREQNGQSEKIAEISFSKDFMQIHFGKTKAVMTEFVPDSRYGHENYSDVVVVDLQSGSQDKVTSGRRIYNPSMNESESKIIAVEFKKDQSWGIIEFDLQGNEIQSFALPEGKFSEARYLDDSRAVAIFQNKLGDRSLVEVDLKAKSITKTLIPHSRNMLTSLVVDPNKNILFEAQYRGYNEIFMIAQNQISRCSESKIGAYTPNSDGTNLYYSKMDTYGTVIAMSPLASCKNMAAGDLVDFKYLGDGPSDNYNKFAITGFPDQESMFTKNKDSYLAQDYGDFDRGLFIPHTWGFALGRGGGLGFQTDNYLRTLSTSFVIGTDPEEHESFANFAFNIKKYYPILSLQAETRNRSVTDFDTDDITTWEENNAGLGVIVPYIKQLGLYNFTASLSGGFEYTDASNYEFNKVDVDGSDYFYKTSSGLSLSWFKAKHARSIQAPWLLSYQIHYDNAENPAQSESSSYRVFQEAVLQTPGAFANDGFVFSFDEQVQEDGPGNYRFLPAGISYDGYVFSRGYDYKEVPKYQKLSGNYVFPIMYPNVAIPRWYYLKQVYGQFFFDSTYVTSTKVASTLNSYGAEARFESVFFRFIPMTWGARVLQKLDDNEVKGELFFASSFF
ncbi:hypothetical protein [Bdellovibrio sp. HCB2-146]|uniref:hypothetical protein n=1 Tax=Bdellovibrio sp. HCB2-146 TaxID=3394362 RepID=UPI0039BC25D4